MIIGVLSDVHSNLQALERVLEDARGVGAQRLWCLGDIVGYGAEPNPVCERLAAAAHVVIAGNHDWAAIGKMGTESFNPVAAEAAHWTARVLSDANKAWLAGLPLVRIEDDVRLVHATPSDPAAWNYVLSVADAEIELGAYQETLCLIGHSHFPGAFETDGLRVRYSRAERVPLVPGRRYLVNVGSVGQPRDGDPRAAYLLYDTDGPELVHRRLEYDVGAAQERIRAAGLPEYLAARLGRGT